MTGIRASSPGFSTCWVKQKHWILVKYFPAWGGLTLKAALPVIVLAERFLAVKMAISRSPIVAIWVLRSGAKRHGRVGETLASKRTDTSLPATGPGAVAFSARWVVPLKPVTWQKIR